MSLLVLFSTFSISVEKHFCGDRLIDTALFSESKKCGFENESSNDLETKITKKSCCKDVVDIIEGQDELQKQSFDDLNFQEQLLFCYTYSFLNLFEVDADKTSSFTEYSTPKLVVDISIRDQVFLI